MPQAIVFVVNWLAVSGAISVATAVAIGTFAATWGSLVLLVGGMAYSSYAQSKARKQARDQYNAAQVDRLQNISSTTAPRELVMGRARKGGAVFYKASTGQDQQVLYLAIALAGHEIDAIEEIYLNDVLVTLDGSGNVTTAPYATSATFTATTTIGGPYIDTPIDGSIYEIWGDSDGPVSSGNESYQYAVVGSTVNITSYLGGPGQSADPALLAAFPSDWTADKTVEGCAYIVAKLTYSETAFPSGVPNITAVIRGAKIYDPRTALTVWSENPALMMRHVYTHPKFGQATVSADEDARIVVAANACDTATVYTVGGVAQPSTELFKASLVLPFGAPPKSGFDDLAQAMGGSWAFAGGELYLKAGVYTAPVLALTDADLAVVQRSGASETQSPISISVHKERSQKFNTVKIKIWDQDQDYKQTDLKPLVGTALLTRDGLDLVQEVMMPAVGSSMRAQHIAGIMMRDARDALVVDLPFKLRAYPLELFDTVTLTLARYGWSAKQFMILSRVWTLDGNIQLSLKETSASITQMDAGFLAQGFAANTNLPKPWDIVEVGALTVASGTDELVRQLDGTVTSRMRISWAQVPDAAVRESGRIEVQYRLSSSTGAWASLIVPGDETQVVTSEVTDDAFYLIRARSRTTLAVSDWNLQVQHQVIGKTEAPPPVDRFKVIEQPDGVRQFFWYIETPPADLFAFEVRYSLGTTERPWDSMIPLFAKDRNARQHETTEPINDGVYVFAIRCVDTTDNLSTLVYTTEVLDGGAFGTVLLIALPHEEDWPGTKTDCYLFGAILEDVGTLTWNDIDIAWEDTESTWGNTSVSPIIYEHTMIDLGASILVTLRAASLSSGTALIEVSTSDDDITYSAWAEVPESSVTARYYKFRWTVTGTAPILYRAQVVFYT